MAPFVLETCLGRTKPVVRLHALGVYFTKKIHPLSTGTRVDPERLRSLVSLRLCGCCAEAENASGVSWIGYCPKWSELDAVQLESTEGASVPATRGR